MMILEIGGRIFDYDKRTYIMGILNVTPDSFSDGGKYTSTDNALKQAEKMILEGADILDIGGESTRPGHIPVSAEEELERVIPVIEALCRRFDIPVSIDTYKSRIAEEAVTSGANLINDIWGFKKDPDMAGVAARHQIPCCLMHNRQEMNYNNFLEDVITDLGQSISIAKLAGVKDENIILDPGLGFAKDYHMNLCMMKNLDIICNMGYPVLLGASRKRFIGTATEETAPESRDAGTAATTTAAILKGCRIIRVHNVAINKKAAMMADCMRIRQCLS